MASANFALVGDDPSIAPDVLPISTDVAANDAPLDPLIAATSSDNSAPPIYGPSIAQLGADPSAPNIIGTADPSSFNSSSTTNSTPGTSVLDSIFKLGSLGLGIASAASGRGLQTSNPATTSKTVATAKGATGAGTGMSLIAWAVIIFVGIMLFLEFKH